MCALWMRLCSLLVLVAGLSEPGRCPVGPHESSSPLLDSLRCYNNYMSYVHCEWRNPEKLPVQLWFEKGDNREPCLRHSAPEGGASEPRMAQCRHQTKVFAIGISYTVFFVEDDTERLCQQTLVNLSQHLRTRPPVELSSHDADDGGCRLSWSGPYPPSSSLNKGIAYQLDYRRDRGDNWTTHNVNTTSLRLDKQQSLQGCEYQARVRARVSGGQWSDWSPGTSRQPEEAAGGGRPPALRCLLVGEQEVKCSWEVSAEVSQVITHQLLCRRNRTALTGGCCVNQRVNSDPAGQVLTHSCSLTVAEPGNLLLELLPTRNARTFKANQHIRPDPPEQVKVREKGNNWVVDWSRPSRKSKAPVYYQLCYYSKEEECSFQKISQDTMSFNIPQASLVPSQKYQVKVRSLVVPGDGAIYGGVPSEWSVAATWTSHRATWSLSTLIYFLISMFVAAGFFTIYCGVMACQRKVTLWVDSIPSPGKSKIMSEIKVAKSRTQTLLKKPSVSKDQYVDNVLTWPADVSLWSNKSGKRKHSGQDHGCWECDKQAFICDHGNKTDTYGMGFSRLYILCWEESQLDGVRDTPSSEHPAALSLTVGERSYVCLPSHCICSPAQHRLSNAGVTPNPHQDYVEQQQWLPDPKQMPDKVEDKQDLIEPPRTPPCGRSSSSRSPPAYTSGPFTGWPQGVSIQASGYCQLPTGHA